MTNYYKHFKRCLMVLAMSIVSLSASAQLDDEAQGYVNVFIRAQVVSPGDGPQVWLTIDGNGLSTWRTTFDFKKTLPVQMLGNVFFLANARDRNGVYQFAGWYVDDGDGVFDIDKDGFESATEKEAYFSVSIDNLGDNITVYDTEAEAQAATDAPTEPQIILWAVFSRGASVFNAYNTWIDKVFGKVSCDKPTNDIGDVVTVTAEPMEGYQFEYWRSNERDMWRSDDESLWNQPDDIVSYDNPYTFTVQGGEKLYAYYSEVNAPVVQFPEQGGWKIMPFSTAWVLHNESDATCYVLTMKDLTTRDDKLYIDTNYEEYSETHHYTQYSKSPTIMYGKGEVRMAYRPLYGHSREGSFVQYSGSKAITVEDKMQSCYFYRWVENMEGFFLFATTDINADPDAPTKVSIPAETAYIQIDAYELFDPSLGLDLNDEAGIPDIIALSDKAFGPFQEVATDIEKANMQIHEGRIGDLKVYTLSGMQVRATNEPGIYIVNGRKVVVK